MLLRLSILETVCLSFLMKDVVSNNINNKLAKKSTRSENISQTLCEMTSTHPKQLIGENVCITEDYSAVTNFNESTRPHLGLVFYNIKVVNVDEIKREITLDFLALILWEDERIKAFFPPAVDFFDLPPVTTNLHASIWSPLTKVSVVNKRNQKYIQDPIVANLKLIRSELINRLYENISFSGNHPIVKSIINWSTTISCSFNFANFPFDKNKCHFVFRILDMYVSLGRSKRSLEGLVGISDVDGFKIEVNQTSPRYQHFNDLSFTDVELIITIQRQAPKYIYQYYIPCMTIVIASSFSFIIPLTALPGRVALVVTQFLTLTHIFINQQVNDSA